MTNEERRTALARARTQAKYYAELVDEAETGDWGKFPVEKIKLWIMKATMWANVANALKVGDPTGPDAVIERD